MPTAATPATATTVRLARGLSWDNWGNLATEQGFIRFLRGRANVAPIVPSTSMPNFAEASLPDKQAKDIYAYIRTFKSSAPELKDIPTLNAIVDAAKQEKK